MAPNFFQKLVKSNNSDVRERNSSDAASSPRPSIISTSQRNRSQSASVNPITSPTTPTQSVVNSSTASSRRSTKSSEESRIPSIITTLSNGTRGTLLGKKQDRSRSGSSSNSLKERRSLDSVNSSISTQPNVTIVPPSPQVASYDLSDSDDEDDLNIVPEEEIVTPTAPKQSFIQGQQATMSSTLAPGAYQVRKQPSNKSMKKGPPPEIATTTTTTTEHMRSATAPPDSISTSTSTENGSVIMKPIVESPTDLKFPSYIPSTTASPKGSTTALPATNGSTTNVTSPAAQTQRENTLAAGSKRPWKRSTTRKPTGLASAIAASGLAMANPSVSAQISPPPILSAGSSKSSAAKDTKESSKTPYMSLSPATSSVSQRSRSGSVHAKSRSADIGSPRSNKSRKSSIGSGGGPRARRTSASASAYSDAGSTNGAAVGDDVNGSMVRAEYFSGLDLLDDGSSDEDGDGDGSGSEDMDDEDIPVTGFAVASNKRNADFHELFPTVPEGDYLIEDYGCALQREILIQGRIYISENHICFHANIFGWITDLEKKMTAFVIPNAIQITTRQAKYTFASFLSRDTTFDVIYNIWRLARPEDSASFLSSGRGSMEGVVGAPGGGPVGAGGAGVVGVTPDGKAAAVLGGQMRKATQCTCGKEGKHYSETALEAIIPGTPEKIHNLIFASGFIKDFMVGNQKLLDVQMSDWAPVNPGSKLLTRNMSYIKPLNGSLGPKQTKCEIKDETVHCDFENYISTVTTTRTPEVPSGGVFAVKTRTCITWAGPISSKVLVTTQVEWSGRSFIKGIIERSAIDGQKVYHTELEKAMRAYIQEHQSEFLPEGIDAAAIIAPPEAIISGTQHEGGGEKPEEGTTEELKRRERERNARGLQWAWDTFDGAYQVARRSTKGALELVRDAWDQSTSTTILWFVIVILVFSNLWTLTRMSSGREVAKNKIEARRVEEREKWVQSIVTALWDELDAGKREAAQLADSVLHSAAAHGHSSLSSSPLPHSSPAVVEPTLAVELPPVPSSSVEQPPNPKNWVEEVQRINEMLDVVEQRVKAIRESLVGFEGLNSLD
ncbi:hypothetical protein M413DRAFT_30292 [Hebeloma cylindrosporum]|uniref:VASt domain-containing protein n=1 Tax=Hebeloma cylindrosporum TaxID=76867 RepID=A0A0C3C3K0_HEBCY|nr:hypothetical protein M413DRAFT_30292 [Hebeloma cylindrosporum h7]